MVSSESNGYKIWAVDNVVYGPVELPILVTWVQEERVTADSWVYCEAGNAWSKAGKMAELSMFFKKKTSTPRIDTAYDTALRSKNDSIKPGSLRRIKIFAAMSDQQLADFVQHLEVKNVRQWTDIVKQGEPGDAMYFVLEGEVRVRLMIGGKESILTTLGTGEFFGEISLFDHGSRSADVVANQESVLLKLSAAAFQKLAETEPALATPFLLAIGRTLTGQIRADNKRFRDSVAFARGAMN